MARAPNEQWCKWLQIPLELDMAAGKPLLFKPLLEAGAGNVRAISGREETLLTNGTGAGNSAPSPYETRLGTPVDRAATAAAVATVANTSSYPGLPLPQVSREPPASSFMQQSPSSPSSGAAVAMASRRSPVAVTVRGSRANTNISGVASAAPFASNFDNTNPRCPRGGGSDGGAGGGANIDLVASRMFFDEKLCLHQATKDHDSARMRELLAAGVDRHATDLWGCTALHRAAEQGRFLEPVRILLAAGLDVRARDMEGYTPLHFAAARGAEEAITDFLAAGSCVAERGNNGDTPLHSAARFLSLSTVRILLEADADENAQNEDGDTPMDVTGVHPDGRDIEGPTDPLVAQKIVALLTTPPGQRRWGPI